MFEEYDHSTSSYSNKGYNRRSTRTKSNKSSNCSSLKGSTNYQSRLKFKTETCKYWANQIECPYGQNCNFAHGDVEMRNKNHVPTKYKTKECQKFNQEGHCPYGTRCQFIHSKMSAPKLRHQAVLTCLVEASDMFFSFLDEKEVNMGISNRLSFFQKIIKGDNGESDSIIEQIVEEEYANYVDVRSRHNSF